MLLIHIRREGKRGRGSEKERHTQRQHEDGQKKEGEREGKAETQKNIDVHSTSSLIPENSY